MRWWFFVAFWPWVAYLLPCESPLFEGGPEGGWFGVQLDSPADEVTQDRHEPAALGGWFGVQLDSPTPDLAAQLGLEGTGLVVLNVSAGSPADTAGVQQYDVITAFAGEQVCSDASALAERIRQRGSGDVVEVTVLRRAQPVQLEVVLGERPGEYTWKYAESPNRLLRREYQVTGKVLHLTPEGRVEVNDLGQFMDIPPELAGMVPDILGSTSELWIEDGRPKSRTQAIKGNVRFIIETDPDGRIHVSRFEAAGGGQGQHTTYDDARALREADPDAYEIYSRTSAALAAPPSTATAQLPKLDDGPLTHDERVRRFNEWVEVFRAVMQQLNQQVSDAQQDYDAALKAFESARDKIMQMDPQGAGGQERPASFRFEALAGGRIMVKVRRGDAELAEVYGSAEDLRKARPLLFERYDALKASTPDE